MSRREYGSGSVYQRGRDGRWVGTIEAGWTREGTRQRISVTGKTRADVVRKLRDKRRLIEVDGLASITARTTVKAWAEEWLTARQRTIRPKPWATDASAVGKWIIPTIGHRRLDELTPRDIRAVAEAQRAAGRSSSTGRRTHTTLTALLRAALLEGHQVPARVLHVPAPALASNDRAAMTVPEAMEILEHASHLPHGSRWAVAFLHGMRQAECLGLTWDAVDFDRGVVVVEWQLQPIPYLDRKNKRLGFRIPDGYEARRLVDGFHLTRPKSKRGHRIIPLVPAMAAALHEWQLVAPPNPWGLVWTSASGRPADAKADLEEWYALQGSAGVGHPAGRYYYVHEARHTTATQLMEAGVDEHVVTALLGHSSIVTSRGYMHTRTGPALDAMTQVAHQLQIT
jgi:integrase